MELDYYDYNVTNAGAAPGSYLGMDPAFLVWIPPLDDESIIQDVEEEREPHYEEILPKHEGIDPGSNTETPEDEQPTIPMKPPRKSLTNTDCVKNFVNSQLNVCSLISKEPPKNNHSGSGTSNKFADISAKDNNTSTNIQLQEFTNNKFQRSTSSPTKIHKFNKKEDIEKETAVVKSPSDNKINEYYELSDIKFADDDEIIPSEDPIGNELIDVNRQTMDYPSLNTVIK